MNTTSEPMLGLGAKDEFINRFGQYLSVSELARALNVHYITATRMLDDGRVAAMKIEAHRYAIGASIYEHLERQAIAAGFSDFWNYMVARDQVLEAQRGKPDGRRRRPGMPRKPENPNPPPKRGRGRPKKELLTE